MWKIEKTRKNFPHAVIEAVSWRAKWAESGRGTATRAQGNATEVGFGIAVPAGELVRFACKGVCDDVGPLGPLGPLRAHIPAEIRGDVTHGLWGVGGLCVQDCVWCGFLVR